MLLDELKPNITVRGPIVPEPVQVIVVVPMGHSVKLVGKGLNTGQVHEPILNPDQLAQLTCTADREPFDGDPLHFRLGIEALRLALAYEYDPYFSLSIARVDPLNFYNKVLSKFASGKGLSLSVMVEVSPESGVSRQKAKETKVALRELGLEDDAGEG